MVRDPHNNESSVTVRFRDRDKQTNGGGGVWVGWMHRVLPCKLLTDAKELVDLLREESPLGK